MWFVDFIMFFIVIINFEKFLNRWRFLGGYNGLFLLIVWYNMVGYKRVRVLLLFFDLKLMGIKFRNFWFVFEIGVFLISFFVFLIFIRWDCLKFFIFIMSCYLLLIIFIYVCWLNMIVFLCFFDFCSFVNMRVVVRYCILILKMNWRKIKSIIWG